VIRRLPKDVVERIAAGEVVERPASVVKELVENALDAGAGAIAVQIERGGLGLVRVVDDGAGLEQDDLALAFVAHATSKLVDVDDLFHIASFGFRGEALASIGAVARCRLTTTARGATSGHRVECQAGVLRGPQPVAPTPGTTVEVRDLFFNTPARREFLASASAEAARCREVCQDMALVHPGVRWRFESDGRVVLEAEPGGDLRRRVGEVHGRALADEMLAVGAHAEGLRLEGLITTPGAARARPRVQRLFLNGRIVKDRTIQGAVRVACRDFIPPSLQPAYVLHLTIDPAAVDVNVHPTKQQVRLRDADAVFRLVRRAVRRAHLDADLAPRVKADQVGGAPLAAPPPAGGAARVAEAPGPSGARGPTPAPSDAAGLPFGGPAAVSGRPARPAARYLQVLDTYLVMASPDGLLLVDQHALHERILYARLQAALDEGRVASQRLLVPEPVTLSPSHHARALELRDELARLGLEIEPFGEDVLSVCAVPGVLRHEPLAELLEALVEPPDLHGGIPSGLDRRLFTMACHAAIKAGDALEEAQIADLLRQAEELEHASSCPHGRPTTLLVGPVELERLFKRDGF